MSDQLFLSQACEVSSQGMTSLQRLPRGDKAGSRFPCCSALFLSRSSIRPKPHHHTCDGPSLLCGGASRMPTTYGTRGVSKLYSRERHARQVIREGRRAANQVPCDQTKFCAVLVPLNGGPKSGLIVPDTQAHRHQPPRSALTSAHTFYGKLSATRAPRRRPFLVH